MNFAMLCELMRSSCSTIALSVSGTPRVISATINDDSSATFTFLRSSLHGPVMCLIMYACELLTFEIEYKVIVHC
jgi:hypothetical protein